MTDTDSLTLAFITAHPAEAARVLERINVNDAAALIERVPARASAPVLAAMLPSAAARMVALLDFETAASQLGAAGTLAVVTILRQMPEPARSRLVSGLPTTVAMASRLLLRYPDHTVGAWVDPNIIVLSEETTVSDAIARVSAGNEQEVDHVFAVDRAQNLVGVIGLSRLLQLPGTLTLAGNVRKAGALLNAGSPITAVAKRRGWDKASALPVVDRDGRLIGVLWRGVLDRALVRDALPEAAQYGAPLPAVLAQAYWNAFSILADATVSVLPRARPIVAENQ